MTPAELRWMKLAEQLVLGALANESGFDIGQVGKLLCDLTPRDLQAIRKGEKWGRARSWPLDKHDARNVLREMRFKEMEEFAYREGYLLSDLQNWAVGHSDIPGGALSALHNLYEIAQSTRGEKGGAVMKTLVWQRRARIGDVMWYVDLAGGRLDAWRNGVRVRTIDEDGKDWFINRDPWPEEIVAAWQEMLDVMRREAVR